MKTPDYHEGRVQRGLTEIALDPDIRAARDWLIDQAEKRGFARAVQLMRTKTYGKDRLWGDWLEQQQNSPTPTPPEGAE